MADSTCRRNSWLLAAGCGAVLALILVVGAGHGAAQAALSGAIAALILGLALQSIRCSANAAPSASDATGDRADAEPSAVVHSLDWQVADSTNQRHAILGGTAPLPPREDYAEDAAPAEEPGAGEAPVAQPAATRPARARPALAAAPKPAAKARKAPAAKAPRAAGIDAAMGRTHEDAPKNADTLLLLAPRDGKADDLKQIAGVGPALERLLNEVGVWHFDQIAGWKAKDIAFVDAKLKTFKGRITRDGWVKQARALARDAAKAK